MKRLSELAPASQPEISPADDWIDVLAFDGSVSRDPGTEPPPHAPATAREFVTIRAPRGQLAVRPGFTVYAIELADDRDEDGDEVILAAQPLSNRLDREESAKVLCFAHSVDQSMLHIRATVVVVNDHTGTERYRQPVLRAA